MSPDGTNPDEVLPGGSGVPLDVNENIMITLNEEPNVFYLMDLRYTSTGPTMIMLRFRDGTTVTENFPAGDVDAVDLNDNRDDVVKITIKSKNRPVYVKKLYVIICRESVEPTVTTPIPPCYFGRNEYADEFGRYLPVGSDIGIVDDDGIEGPSDGDSTFEIGDYLSDGETVYLDPDYCDTCVCEDGELKCEDYDCPVDCIISTWSDWGSCSVESCGGGYRERTREVTPGTYGGEACPCDVLEREYCNEDPCEVDGEWSTWSSWSSCEVACGGGIIIRTRTCDDPEPSSGGADCVGSAIEVDECNMEACADECGTNKQMSYDCSRPLSCFDVHDSDAKVEQDSCETGCRCKGNMVMTQSGECVSPYGSQCDCYDKLTNDFISGGDKVVTDDGCTKVVCSDASLSYIDLPCSSECEYSEWGEFGVCTAQINGYMRRYRYPESAPGYGVECTDVYDDQPCGEQECKKCIIDGVTYPTNEIIPSLSKPCEEQCFCNSDGELDCHEIAVTCEPCLHGFELQPTESECCKCVPVVSECSLQVQTGKVEITDEDGNVCQSVRDDIRTTSCEGACASSDSPTFYFTNGFLSHKKSCKCCSGVDPLPYVKEEFKCTGGKSIYVKIQNFNKCECEICEHSDEI